MPSDGPDRAAVLTWDWREQPDLNHLSAIIRDLSGGRIHLTPTATGTDEYALIVSTAPVDEATAAGLYRQWQTDGRDTWNLSTPDSGSHHYLSTACLHGRHDHCRSTTAADGTTKQPGTCKFCGAVCACPACDHASISEEPHPWPA